MERMKATSSTLRRAATRRSDLEVSPCARYRMPEASRILKRFVASSEPGTVEGLYTDGPRLCPSPEAEAGAAADA
jgi:hypothetical protein